MTVDIPHQLLSPESLTGVLESVVLREGTDYGEVELDFAAKVARLRAAVERGEARIVFDPETETVTVVPATGMY
ncbi:MAG: YheU family protein [Steroidobacteraceae bacterium]